MIGFWLGVFLLVVCVLMIIFAGGDLFGLIGVAFVICIAIGLIMAELNKRKRDKKTSKQGEKCYAKILDCVKTGSFVFSKEEYKVIVAVYVPSLKQRLIKEEIVGFNKSDAYPKDSYFEVLFYNDDINVVEMVDKGDVAKDILDKLDDKSVSEEYHKYIKEMEQERKEKEEELSEKAERVIGKINKAYVIYTVVGFYIFSIIVIFITDYFSKMLELLKDFSNKMPMSIIYPLVLVINLSIIFPMVFSPENSKRRVFFGLLWFLTMAFIMFQGAF